MSLATWTPDALSSELRDYAGGCWRLVESQYIVSTLKLVDSLAEQTVLEELVEASALTHTEGTGNLSILARMCLAGLVQTYGLGSVLCSSRYRLIAA